ncbi:MAG TPA: Uma2 family endonuclease [Bryobacteraceae bacterium]|nr:Uma2 family endonuclease [Bryobacteraceae bacterium]
MSAQQQALITPEEYLDRERLAETKSEYWNGVVLAMAGGSSQHDRLQNNLVREIGNALKTHPCRTAGPDLRLRVAGSRVYTYPDMMILCGKTEYADDQRDTVLNPVVVIEILSRSTEAYDRGEKFAAYRRLPSLQEYLLVSQSQPRVERFRRLPDDRWILTEVTGMTELLQLESVPCQVPMAEIYDRVEFSGQL